jgi:GR25 family glycosyltransferase involved in LPS biosynthesis
MENLYVNEVNSIKIDTIYVINLESDIERRKKIMEIFEKNNINNLASRVIYFKAIDYRNKSIGNNIKFIGTEGGYGCTQSHLSCIKDAIEKNYNNILIFEDDIIIHKDFLTLWKNIKVPNDWKIIHLGAMQINWTEIHIDKESNFYRSWKTLGGFSYIINREMFSKFLEYYEIHGRPNDEICILLQNEYPCYTIFPNLFINNINKSYIRYRNTWTLQKTGKHFRWEIDDYVL